MGDSAIAGSSRKSTNQKEAVKTWVRDLRDWAYDAGVVDISSSSRRMTRFMVRVLNLIVFWPLMLFSSDIYRESSSQDGWGLCLVRCVLRPKSLEVGVYNSGETWQRAHATSLYFHTNIYGRADVERRIINLLLGIGNRQGSSGANKLDVVIVSMEVIGKIWIWPDCCQ